MKKRTFRPMFEHLEDRCTPAAMYSFDGTNVTITGDPGALLNITQAAGMLTVVDSSGPVGGPHTVTGDITVTLSASAVLRTITLDLAGPSSLDDVSISTGNSSMLTTINVVNAVIGDIFSITGGNGVEDLNAAVPVNIGGSVSINLAAGSDSADLFTGASVIGGSVTLTNVNLLGSLSGTIGGNLTINNSADAAANTYSITPTSVGGSLFFTGGIVGDDITALSGSFAGSSNINLGNGVNSITSSADFLSGLNLLGGTGNDTFTLNGNVLGNVYVNLGHGATNSVTFGGTILGSAITVYGGNGMDTVAFGASFSAIGARMSAYLGNAADTFDATNLGSNDLASLYIDYGYGIDIYTPALVALAFPVTHRNK